MVRRETSSLSWHRPSGSRPRAVDSPGRDRSMSAATSSPVLRCVVVQRKRSDPASGDLEELGEANRPSDSSTS